jgi:hypothetical protein
MEKAQGKRIPTQADVRSIMNEVYNVWFSKYKNATTDNDFQNAIREAHELNEKYPFELCETLIIQLILIIESYYREGIQHVENR